MEWCLTIKLIWCMYTWTFVLMLGYLSASSYKLTSWSWSNQYFLGPPIPSKTAELKHSSFYEKVRELWEPLSPDPRGCNLNTAKRSPKSLTNNWCNIPCNTFLFPVWPFQYSLHFVKSCSTYPRLLHSLSLGCSSVSPKSMSFILASQRLHEY